MPARYASYKSTDLPTITGRSSNTEGLVRQAEI
jgi:hypothetical protein